MRWYKAVLSLVLPIKKIFMSVWDSSYAEKIDVMKKKPNPRKE
jgi:hypothetical protein